MSMNLKSLSIRKAPSYSKNPHEFTGQAEFANPDGKLEIVLNEETSRKILEVVADQLVETAKETAAMMTSEIIEGLSAPLLEND